MDWVAQGAITVGVGVVVWYLTSRVESIRREKESLQDERRKIYSQVLEPYIRIFAGAKKPTETKKAISSITSFEYRRASFELTMIGSDDVVRALNEMMQFSYRMGDGGSSASPEDLLRYWGGLLLAIRRDLGNKGTKLSEVDMFRSQIKDIDQFTST